MVSELTVLESFWLQSQQELVKPHDKAEVVAVGVQEKIKSLCKVLSIQKKKKSTFYPNFSKVLRKNP